jgi:hypothetical protein
MRLAFLIFYFSIDMELGTACQFSHVFSCIIVITFRAVDCAGRMFDDER